MNDWAYLKCSWSDGMFSSEACIEIPVFGERHTYVFMDKSELIPLDKDRCFAAVTLRNIDKDVAVISLSDLFEQKMRIFRVKNNYLI